MKAFSLVALVAGAWLASVASAGRGADADKDELQGVWVATSMEINGKPAPAKEVERTRFTFKGEKLLVRHAKDDGQEEEGTFKADRNQSPKQLDITVKKKTLAGIYEVKGDELKVCYENGGNAKNRPTKFATNKEEELVLIVFKRLPVQGQDNEAEKLFRDMHKKLAAADAIRFSVSTEIKTGNKDRDSSFKGSVLLAKGNKAQLKWAGATWTGELVSNGEQAYLTLGGRETTVATPKHLNGVLIFFVSRTGVLLTLQAMQSFLRGLGDTRPEDLFKGADRDRAAVWDFKLAPAEKFEGREVKVVNFRYGPRNDPGMPISISIDAKTLLPLKLVIDYRQGGVPLRGIITETYSEFTLEPKIDAKAFVLPK
jgi:uncharacterized protein (TIGR03067 family)